MFFKSILPKIGIILIYSLVIESGLEAGFPSLAVAHLIIGPHEEYPGIGSLDPIAARDTLMYYSNFITIERF